MTLLFEISSSVYRFCMALRCLKDAFTCIFICLWRKSTLNSATTTPENNERTEKEVWAKILSHTHTHTCLRHANGNKAVMQKKTKRKKKKKQKRKVIAELNRQIKCLYGFAYALSLSLWINYGRSCSSQHKSSITYSIERYTVTIDAVLSFFYFTIVNCGIKTRNILSLCVIFILENLFSFFFFFCKFVLFFA